MAEVKAGLAERDRKVASYRFEGEVVAHSGERVTYRFAYRAPGKLRGDVIAPVPRSWAFDGVALRERDPVSGKVSSADLTSLGRAAAAEKLHAVFSPLAPEGWRAPLFAGSASVVPGGRVRGREVVRVRSEAHAGADTVVVTYLLARPGFDFQGKVHESDGQRTTVTVLDEHCDARLGLCFPTTLEQRTGEGLDATTTISRVVVNEGVLPEFFELSGP